MIIGLVSAKGSPGVTTAALALAAANANTTLVEFDPSGGSIECWTSVPGEPGLLRVANGLRRMTAAEALASAVRHAPAGVGVVHAPTAGTLAEPTIAAIGDRLTAAMSDTQGTVLLDCGRWCRSQPTAHRIVGSDIVLIVCQPNVNGVEAARSIVEPIKLLTNQRPSLLLVGDRPYGAADVEAAVGAPVLCVLPWDPGAVNALLTDGLTRAWLRSRIGRAARAALASGPAKADVLVAS
jgi:MinD-like ATPase involved in chromosome partitioning or flagellar assembly